MTKMMLHFDHEEISELCSRSGGLGPVDLLNLSLAVYRTCLDEAEVGSEVILRRPTGEEQLLTFKMAVQPAKTEKRFPWGALAVVLGWAIVWFSLGYAIR